VVVSLTQPRQPTGAGQMALAQRPVMIETNGFLLRSLVPDDINPQVLSWLSNSEMLQGLNLAGLGFNLDQLRAFVGKFDNLHNYMIGIFEGKSRTLIGFYTLDVDLRHRVGQITTGIGEQAYQGKGALWATIDALLDHFYAERNIDKISARILAKNYRMIFNFRDNTRFILEARLLQECVAPNGERVDILLFSSFKNGPRPGVPQ
jgi:RimJ/RimL family protein N-acetyltransferase